MVFKSDFHLIKAALLTAWIGLSGWVVFTSLSDLLNLNQIPPLWRLGGAIVAIWLSFKLGLRKE